MVDVGVDLVGARHYEVDGYGGSRDVTEALSQLAGPVAQVFLVMSWEQAFQFAERVHKIAMKMCRPA